MSRRWEEAVTVVMRPFLRFASMAEHDGAAVSDDMKHVHLE
jgi:hypothetical protein